MNGRAILSKAMFKSFAKYVEAKAKYDVVVARRGAITGPLYKTVRATEKEHKPAITEAKEVFDLAHAHVETDAVYAFNAYVFGIDDSGRRRARYTFPDGSWIEVQKEKIELEVTDWTVLLLNDLLCDTYVESVTVKLNKVAMARAELGKSIPGVVVHRSRPVKLHVAKPKPEPQEETLEGKGA